MTAAEPPAQHRRCGKCEARYSESTAFCPHDGTRLELALGSLDDRSGEIIAERYRLVRFLGQGGMGQVYEAQHVALDKRIAIKLLRREVVVARPEIIARFRQEARAASSIGHPSIVTISDFAATPDGGVYLAMELLRGVSLADHLRDHSPLPIDEAVRILLEATRGLAAAHAVGIVHRDIKPENLFLAEHKSGTPRLKILDFGIAKMSSDSQPHLTQTGAVFGTPLYMSPEQALGRAVDTRSDVYSLGVIAYQMFAGDVPFRAESLLGVLNQHVQTPARPLGEAAPGRVSPELADVVERMLAKEPAARFQTMDDLTIALNEVVRAGREPTPAMVRTVAPPVRVRHGGGKRGWLAPASLVALVLAGVMWRAKTHSTPTKMAAAPTPSSPTPAPPPLVEPPPLIEPPKPRGIHHRKSDEATTPTTAATTGVDRLAASLAPHAGRIGALVDGHGDHAGDHKDFAKSLHAGRCYTILAMGKPGVIALSLSLADPHGRQVAEQKKFTATPLLKYCATSSGNFSVQAKLTEGSGDFTVGVYADVYGR
jgi:serine/threonine-protein kinase